jgi:heavy metal sensor kinase
MPNLNISLEEDIFKNIIINKKHFRQIQSAISLPDNRQLFVLIASSEEPILDLLRDRRRLFMVSIPIILLLTAFLGRFLTGRILRPVSSIVSTAKQISSQDLSKRLRLEGVDEEMKVLVDSLNDMIARLERSFKHIEEFSSHVAHELKTPLAILRGETEVALRQDQSASEYKAVLQENLEEIEKIIRIIEDLFLLAKLDYQPKFLKFQQFDFKEFLSVIFEQTRLLAEEHHVEISCDLPKEDIAFEGDALHLRRLFFNIINNAIKFTPADKRVLLTAQKEKNILKVSVADEGPGIPEEYLSKIFDKFFQVPSEEEGFKKGSGLGLNIAQSVAKAHQGKIEVQSQLGKGTVFTVFLPLV